MHNLTQSFSCLTGAHGLCDNTLQSQLLLLQVIRGRVLNLELSHGIAESGLDLLLGPTLDLERHCWVGNNLLNSRDV